MIMILSKCILICTVLTLQLTNADHPENINLKSEGTNYLISCDSRQDSSCEDQTLDQVANNLTEHSPVLEGVSIHINTSCLELATNVSFSGVDSLTVSGSIDLNTTIACSLEDHGGLEFNNITSLILTNLTIRDCGFKSYPSTEKKQFLSYNSAVTILCCREVNVSNLIVRNNNGIGLKILNHQGGIVHIVSSIFRENKLFDKSRLNDASYKGGGGVYIGGFDYPREPIIFRFENCIFEENVAHTEHYNYLYTDDLGQPVTGYGLGGGAAIVLHEVLTDIRVIFSGCKFIGNLAFKGGGLAAGIEGTKDEELSNISVSVENSLFMENGCRCNSSEGNVTASGGGMSINFSFRKSPIVHSNKFIIRNVTFKENCAWFGGGLYFYSDTEANINSANAVQIENCTFEGNQAHTGSAIDITPNVFQRLALKRGTVMIPVFKDCAFINNNIKVNFHNDKHSQTTYGIGTLYVSLYSIKFTGCNRFRNNLGTAIHIVNGNTDMSQSSVYFINNTGIQGGAIALIGQSSMIVGPNRTYEFINNTALGKGGGLYIQLDDNHDITASKSCFLQYFDADEYTTIIPARDQTAAIMFKGNRAEAGTGHAMFATSLYPCQSINNGSLDEPQFISIPSSKVFTMRGINLEDHELEIATEGARLDSENSSLRVIPGERFFHEVKITDDLSHKANVTLIASILKNDDDVQVDKAFSSCVGEQLMLKGTPNKSAYLRLQTTTSRQSYIRLEVKLSECPPGFVFKKEEAECVCNHDEYDGFAKCNTMTFMSYIIPGYWAGKVTDENDLSRRELVTSYCPLNFCHYSEDASGSEIQLPQDYQHLNNAICGKTREGISCACCAPGYTTHFHSPNFECKSVTDTPCTVGWLFYILSELVPVTVVFMTLLIFNINFTSGAVNGFILYSQILISLNIDASGFITPTSVITSFLKAHQFIYGMFNLDFFYAEYFSFCLWPNATALDMLAFKYVTIIYILILMTLVIWFINKCNRGMKCLAKVCRFTTIKASVIHGISAFFILCYSECLNVSLKLLRSYSLTPRVGSNLTVYRRVWLNGNIIYFGGKHLPYALPALFCLLTIGLFPLIFLLVYPLLCKCLSWLGYGESKLVTFIAQKLPYNRLKPLLDSLQCCFKDDFRFFAGLYFLYRWIPLYLDVLTSRYHVFYTAFEAGIIIILTLHALCQPYANKVHNIIDTLLFADLALINAITLAHYYVFRTALSRQKAIEYINKTMAVQLVLIYLPLLVMIGYVLLLGYRFVRGKKGLRKNFVSLYLLSSENSRNAISDDDDSDLPHRLLTGDSDYNYFEDTDHATRDETGSLVLDVTY